MFRWVIKGAHEEGKRVRHSDIEPIYISISIHFPFSLFLIFLGVLKAKFYGLKNKIIIKPQDGWHNFS